MHSISISHSLEQKSVEWRSKNDTNTLIPIANTVLKSFYFNFVKEKSFSLLYRSVFFISAGCTVFCAVKEGLIKKSTAISLISAFTLGINWNSLGSRPYQLAHLVQEYLQKREERNALMVIRTGADIYRDFRNGLIRGCGNRYLINDAIAQNLLVATDVLANLGCSVNYSTEVLGKAPTIEMIRTLLNVGAEVNLNLENEPSVLAHHFDTLICGDGSIRTNENFGGFVASCTFLVNNSSTGLTPFEFVLQHCFLITELFSHGAQLKPEEIQKYKALYPYLLQKVSKLNEDSEKIHTLMNIICKIFQKVVGE